VKAVKKSPISENRVFEVKHILDPYFDPNWHFHSEYQLFLVLKGRGTRFIGDHVGPFRPGELILTGPNLPHLWRSDHEYFEGLPDPVTEGIVIYFSQHLLGKDFIHKQELFKVKHLLQKAHRGMEFYGVTRIEATEMINGLLNEEDFDRVLLFLNVINLLSNSNHYRLLASEGYTNSLKETETERMNQVHEYVLKNFKSRISLEAAAAVANLSPTSFSRYFKMHANKTFSDFLIEIRIGYACKLLSGQNMDVAQVCYESGFNTLSNFNKQFKAVTHYTPLAYKKKYSEMVS
jgi:AraC-like DNA-binding protein